VYGGMGRESKQVTQPAGGIRFEGVKVMRGGGYTDRKAGSAQMCHWVAEAVVVRSAARVALR